MEFRFADGVLLDQKNKHTAKSIPEPILTNKEKRSSYAETAAAAAVAAAAASVFEDEEEDDADEGEEDEVVSKRSRPNDTPEATPPPPPPLAPGPLKSSMAFWAVIWILFVFVATVAFAGGYAYVHTLEKFGGGGGGGIPLDISPHNTKSALVDLGDPYMSVKVARMESAFSHQFGENPRLRCLCMHHLKVFHPLQICAVRSHPVAPVVLMLNPVLIGTGNATALYREHSVSCSGAQSRIRHENIVLRWTPPGHRSDTMFAHFEDETAACVQLALSELQGTAHCKN